MGWELPHFVSVSWDQLVLFAALGLVIGSFLNGLIHRMPLMILKTDELDAVRFNLTTPGSHCPHCKKSLAWYELIPLVSYCLSLGRCRHCNQVISVRYPLVEILTAALFCMCLLKFGFGYPAVLGCFFCATLLALAWIDAETFLLPDNLTQALLWVGLIGSAMSLTNTSLLDSLAGAVLGYGLLWLVSWGFERLAGKEGMGQGDLKLLAGLGAWLGVWSLLPLILLASVSGLIFGVTQKIRGQLGHNGHFAFGPFLALSGFACFFLGISMGA
jgi:leader peptidase (prepilin peptidase)/N-methyltransferase